ncbi:SLC13 family permease [Halostella pelagica]|uniref:SLC13 family permease n=1 Tax=Halostella pelagica TaxID=2583824 RepID=UPI0035C0501A
MASVTPAIVVVFAIILVALVLFATEAIPVDMTALGIMVALLLVDPVTGAFADLGLLADSITVLDSPEQGVSGFASTATITVLAMFILSDGVQRTGIVQILGRTIATYTRDDEGKQLGATIGIVGPISGFINNTAAVAILLPMVTNLAHEGKTSPSKLLIPLSYASMFGGTLTLIGTSTNILASDIMSRPEFLGREFGMFEFTALGLLVSVVGTVYLLTVGRWLLPERIKPVGDLTEEFGMGEYLTEVVVRENSPLVGQTVKEILDETEYDVDIVQLVRGDRVFIEPLNPKTVRSGDIFAVRTDRDTLLSLSDEEGLDLLPEVTVDEAELEAASEEQNLVEIVIPPGSALLGETFVSSNFRQRYDATVLALRRGGDVIRRRLDHVPLRIGDTLLVQATPDSIDRLDRNRDFTVAREIERKSFRESKIPVALGIVAGVVAVAAVDFLPIMVAALAGALLMVLTGCLKPGEVYESVQWDVIVLLAGVIPLGLAMENSGAAELIADVIVRSASALPPVAVLGLLYVVTALLTNVISNNASVVLMVPVAFEAAQRLDANAFSFILAVTFAASTAFMTPVGYQTNLFVYGPGGYRFTDYLRVGGPLQLLFAIVTTAGIAVLWGV